VHCNVIEGYPSVRQVVGMPGLTVYHGHMYKYHHQAVPRYSLPVQQSAARAVPMNSSGLSGFQVNATKVAVLLISTVYVDQARHGLPILQNAQYRIYDKHVKIKSATAIQN